MGPILRLVSLVLVLGTWFVLSDRASNNETPLAVISVAAADIAAR